MAKKLLYSFIILISLCSLAFIGLSMTSTNYIQTQTTSESNNQKQKKFRLVSEYDAGEYVSYIFHSSKERVYKTYDDCIGCGSYEDGDTQLWRQFMSKKDAKNSFNGYDDSDRAWTIVKGSASDKKGVERKIVELRDGPGKVIAVRILWIRPTEQTYAYWFIEAPSVNLAIEFEESEAFLEVNKSIPSEPPACNTYGVNSSNYDWCQ